MKKYLLALVSLMMLSNGLVFATDVESQIAEKESEIEELRKQLESSDDEELNESNMMRDSEAEIKNQVAVGASNSSEQIEQLLMLFGLETNVTDSVIYVDGILLDEYLNDGSNENTSIYSSVIVNTSTSNSGLNVEILTPENIMEVSASAYQNAAITAGATHADIKIASVQPVTGEGALGGVYEIFNQAGYNLEAIDIQAGENLIQIEQILLEETNMSDNEISKLITEYNLAIVNAVEGKEELSEQEVLVILNEILSGYNFQFSENVRNMLVSHGTTFSQSDVSKDPNTKKALLETMSRYEVFKEVYTHGDIEVEIKDIYFTQERNEYHDKDYDNALTIQYILTNNRDTETSAGRDFELYVDGVKADHYFLLNDQSAMVSSNRSADVKTSFGFNGSPQNMELELSDMLAWGSDPIIIKLNNDGTPILGSTVEDSQDNLGEATVGSGLSDEVRDQIQNQELIELLDAFVDNGLNVMEPKIMTRQDFGIAPLLADEAVQFGAQYADFIYIDEDGNEELYNYGRMFLVNDSDDLEKIKASYDSLGQEAAMFYSHTFSKGNILLQMGGDVPDADFEHYTNVINNIVN